MAKITVEKAKTDTQGQIVLPDKATNPLRLKPPEGQMMAVVKGNKDGELNKFVASISGWHFKCQEKGLAFADEWEKWELVPDVGSSYKPNPNMPEAKFGIIFVGFLRALHIPHLRYTKWELAAGSDKPSLVQKDRGDSPFFYFQYSMGIPVVEVESKGSLTTTIIMNVVARLVNPYRALFLAGGWESLMDAAINGAVRDHLSDLEIDEIKAEKESGGLATRIMTLNDDVSGVEGFKTKFGVQLIDIRFVGFKIEGDKKILDAIQAKEVSRLNYQATGWKRKEIVALAKAQAEAAKLAKDAYESGEAAAAVRQMELLKEALLGTGANVVAFGGNFPIAITPPAKKTP